MKKEHLLPLLPAAIMIVVLFFDLFAGGKAIFKDQAYEFHYQAAMYVKDELAKGDFPLWNRRAAMGEPFAAYPEYSLFHPLFLPLALVLPPVAAINLMILLQYLIIAGFTAALARRMGISAGGALVSALSFAFCGYLLFLHTEFQNLAAVAALPAALYFFERFRDSGNGIHVAAAGMALGVGHLAGGTQYSYYVDLIFVVWALAVREKEEKPWRRFGKDGLAAVAALVLSAALAAVLLLPAAVMSTFAMRSQIDYDHAAHSPKGPEDRGFEIGAGDLPGFVYPREPGLEPAQSKPVHVGMATLILALIGLSRGEGRRRYLLFVIALVALFISFGRHTPVFRLFYALPIPGMGLFKNPIRIVVICAFCLSLLAGYGADRFLRDRKRHRMLYYGLWIGALFCAAGFAFRNRSLDLGACAVMVSVGLALIAIPLPAARQRLAQILLAVGVMIGMTAAYPVLDLLPQEEVKKRIGENSITRVIKDNPAGRVVAKSPVPSFGFYNRYDLIENTGMARGIDLVDGNSSLHFARYLWFTAAGEEVDPVRLYGLDAFLSFPSLVQMANVAWLIRPLDAPRSGNLIAHAGGNGLERLETPGFARAARAWICADNVEDAREKFRTLRHQEQLPYIDLIEEEGCAPGEVEGAPVTLVSRTADRIEINTDGMRPGYLILSEGYDPRWRVTLNGSKEGKVVPANLGLMAAPIRSEGIRSVLLEYKPRDFLIGASISAFAFAFCLGLLVSLAVAARRPRSGL